LLLYFGGGGINLTNVYMTAAMLCIQLTDDV
jgi:hypothetical protein